MVVFFLFKWFVGLLQVEHHLSHTLVIPALRDIHVKYWHDVHGLNSCSVEGWRSGHVVLELTVRSYSRSQCPCSPSCNQLIDYFLKSFYLTFIPKILQRFAINWHNVIAVWDHLSACSFKEWTCCWIHFKGIVHPKMKVLSSFTYPQVVVQNIFQEWW